MAEPSFINFESMPPEHAVQYFRSLGVRITFDYKGINTRLVETVTVQDVVWTCRLMSRLSDKQWDDAFRAAAYETAERQRFIAKLKSKVNQGLALARS